MYFDFFYTYALRALILPAIMLLVFLVGAIVFAISAIKSQRNLVRWICFSIVALMIVLVIVQLTTLFSGGFSLLSEHLEDAVTVTGTISDTYDEGSFLYAVFGDGFAQPDGQCVSLKIDGVNYIAPAMVLDEFAIGDTVTITVLPESKFIITIVEG